MRHEGGVAAWWYDWVNKHRLGSIVVVGIIATQVATYFGYVFPAIGLPSLPWPAYNGLLIFFAGIKAVGVPPGQGLDSVGGTSALYFVGQSMHYINGIVFSILYALLALPLMPFKNTHVGFVLKGLLYSVVLTIISVGVLVPYAYVPKLGYGFFTFYGPDGWKLPFGVLLWHLIWGFFLGMLYQPKDDATVATTAT